MPKMKPIESFALPGMAAAIEAQTEAAAEELGRQLTEQMRAPLPSIDARTGQIEQHSPLFRESDANPLLNLFSEVRQ